MRKFLLIFILIGHLSLLSVPQPSNDWNEYQKKLCLLLTEKPLVRQCFGRYMRELKLKYKDRMLDINTEYAIWTMEDEPSRVLVSFHRSALFYCRRLKFVDSTKFICLDSDEEQEVPLDYSEIHCIPYRLLYVDELVWHARDCHGNNVPNHFSAIHYSKDFDDNSSQKYYADWLRVLMPLIISFAFYFV